MCTLYRFLNQICSQKAFGFSGKSVILRFNVYVYLILLSGGSDYVKRRILTQLKQITIPFQPVLFYYTRDYVIRDSVIRDPVIRDAGVHSTMHR